MKLHSIKQVIGNAAKHVPLLILFLTYISMGCKGQTPDTIPVNTEIRNIPSAKKQTVKVPDHKYGNHSLEPSNGIFVGETYIDSIRYEIQEVFPGILVYNREPNDYEKNPSITKNTVLIEYYDTSTHKLKKRLDLEKITPYNAYSAYNNIRVGSVDYKYMSMNGPDSNCQRPRLPQSSYYYTRNWIRSVSANGYISVGFELIKMAKPNKVVGWEQTLVVIDVKGKSVIDIKLDHAVWAPVVTDDGNFLYFTHNKSGFDEIFDPCREALSIYDLVQNKLVYYRELTDPLSIGLFDPRKVNHEIIGSVGVSTRLEPQKLLEIIIVKTSLRQVQTYSFTPEEAEKYQNIKSFKEQREYIAHKPFTATKF